MARLQHLTAPVCTYLVTTKAKQRLSIKGGSSCRANRWNCQRQTASQPRRSR